MKASKWHKGVECKKTRKKCDQESCESQAEEAELDSAGNGEPKKASEWENDMRTAATIDCAWLWIGYHPAYPPCH